MGLSDFSSDGISKVILGLTCVIFDLFLIFKIWKQIEIFIGKLLIIRAIFNTIYVILEF